MKLRKLGKNINKPHPLYSISHRVQNSTGWYTGNYGILNICIYIIQHNQTHPPMVVGSIGQNHQTCIRTMFTVWNAHDCLQARGLFTMATDPSGAQEVSTYLHNYHRYVSFIWIVLQAVYARVCPITRSVCGSILVQIHFHAMKHIPKECFIPSSCQACIQTSESNHSCVSVAEHHSTWIISRR